MKIDKDFAYFNGPRGGRTTKMLLHAIELAKEPQEIVVLAHAPHYARTLLEATLNILDENLDIGHLAYAPNYNDQRIDFNITGSAIYFRSPIHLPGRFMARSRSISILVDHHAAEIGIGREWSHAIHLTQSINHDDEIS